MFLTRLNEVLDAVPVGETARKLDVDPKTLLNWRNGKTSPRADELISLAKLTGKHPAWFLGGEEPAPDDLARIPVLDVQAAAGFGNFSDLVRELDTINWPRPFLRKLGANPSKTESLRAKGDSMSPTIEDGALILIDRSQRDLPPPRAAGKRGRRAPDIFVFIQGDDLRIKRIERLPKDWLALISDNFALYPPELVEAADAGRVKIIGKVVWWDNRL